MPWNASTKYGVQSQPKPFSLLVIRSDADDSSDSLAEEDTELHPPPQSVKQRMENSAGSVVRNETGKCETFKVWVVKIR